MAYLLDGFGNIILDGFGNPIITPGPTVTNAQDIINFALKASGVLGVGQSAQAQDMEDSFAALNMMLSVWNRDRWLIWHLLDAGAICTGAEYYTVGPGKQIDIPRPDRIESAYLRQIVNGTATILTDPGGAAALQADGAGGIKTDGVQPIGGQNIDFPLTLLQSHEDYANIRVKGLTSLSRAVFYDSAYPTGALYPWPIPQAAIYEIHILVKDTLTEFLSLTTDITIPPEFKEALWSNLALRQRMMYRITAPPPGQDDLKNIATAALNIIRSANAQVPRLSMPAGVLRSRGSSYWIYSGGY